MAPEHSRQFQLLRNNHPITSCALDARPESESVPTVGELDPHGFCVTAPEPDIEYRILIGDTIPVGEAAIGVWLGSAVYWRQLSQYFESARGRVIVTLQSKPLDEGEERWRERARLAVNVLPTKLGDRRYESMVGDLRRLAAGLVFDLVSKSSRGVATAAPSADAFGVRSSQLELRVLEKRWPGIEATLREIEREPVVALQSRRERRNVWGSERLSPRAISELASVGVGTRHDVAPPFRVVTEHIVESRATTEHSVIAEWLELLATRVAECRDDAFRHARALERRRAFRDHAFGGERSLFETEDQPRIRRLEHAIARADALEGRIRAARGMSFLRGVRPQPLPPRTPVFDNVAPYRRLRREGVEYLGASLVTSAEGADERAKSTSKLYEQWTFFQLAAAFRVAGLRASDSVGVIQQVGRSRFTVDLEADSRISFTINDRSEIVVRYEPTILPEAAAKSRRDALYRGRGGAGAAPWSPDIIIEFLGRPSRDEPAVVENVVVVDAKYSRAITTQWSGTEKYFEIRASHNDHQIVRQLWLSFPGEEDGIRSVDDAVRWTATGPDCPKTDRVRGTIALRPAEELADDDDLEGTWMQPTDVALEFATGLLAYFGR